MKKAIFLLFVLTLTMGVRAQKVALHSATGVQHFNGYNGFAEACAAAADGDTLYLPGGGFAQPAAAINKSLVIFGTGHYPDSTAATGKTIINGNISLSENADDFQIEGIDLTGGISTTSNHAVDRICIKYCRLQGGINIAGDKSNPSNNLLIANSIIQGSVKLTNARNAAILNSIFNADIQDTEENLIKNNIFLLNNYSFSTYRYTIYGSNNLLENNIFVRTADREISGYSNTVKNNITPKTEPYWGTTPVDAGNYTGVSETTVFVNQTGNVFNYAHNYHLRLPENYSGADGTEVGIYGGMHPYKEGAVPSNPHFVVGNIAEQSDAEGKLNIEIKVTAQDR